MTVHSAVHEFIGWCGTHMEHPNTYRVALRPLLEVYGESETEDVTVAGITKITEGLRSNFMFLTVLKVFSRYCHYAKIEFINPNLIRVKRKYDPVERPFLERGQIREMCDCLEEDTFLGVRNKLIISLLSDTGMRISELLSMKLSEIDAQKRELKIFTKKAHMNRYVAWSRETHHLLQTYLAMRISKDWKTDQLFINKNGAKLTKRGVEYMFAKVSEEALGERHHPHECRHGKAHSIIEQGGEAFAVKTVLGHKNLQSALLYLRLHARESLVFARKYI